MCCHSRKVQLCSTFLVRLRTFWTNLICTYIYIIFIMFVYTVLSMCMSACINPIPLPPTGCDTRSISTELMAKQKQDDQLEHTYSSYVRIWDVALKTCQKRWMIGRSGERGSGISVLVAQHDDDDDDESWFEFKVFLLCLPYQSLRTKSALLFTYRWWKKRWIDAFPQGN